MSQSRLFVVIVVVGSFSCLLPSQLPGQSPSTAPTVKPQPLPAKCAAHPVKSGTPDGKCEAELSNAEHLRLAAMHLEAAGREELAAELAKEMSIESKLEQIRELQTEIAQLRAGKQGPVTLMIQMKLIEVQANQMRKLGLTFQDQTGTRSGPVMVLPVMDPATVDHLLEMLQSSKLAKILAEPTMMTVSGRPASFHSGGEIPIIVPTSLGKTAVEFCQTGTRVDCVGTVLKSGKIRLELRSTVTEVDASRGIMLEDISVPGLRTRNIDTAIEMEDGQTVLLGGLIHKPSDKVGEEGEEEATSLIIAATVQRVNSATEIAIQANPRY